MFSLRFPRQFVRNLQPLLSPAAHRSFSGSQKIPTPFRPRIRKSPNRKPSSSKKPNPEPKVYSAERIRKIYNILKYSTWDSAQEQLQALPFKWDSYTVNQVLKTHPPMEKAWLFFNWASNRKNFKHDQFTYTTMLDIFGEAKRISSMMYVFGQMKEKGVKIDVVTYTSLMHWVSNDGDVQRAIELWKEMKAKGCHPTVVSYTAFMKILFHHEKASEAGHVYKEMLRSGLSPNCHTYTVLMEHLSNSGKFHETMEIFNKMQEAGVLPDKATCNILIEICCRAGETGTIMKILEYMKENFIVLRYSIYQKALDAFETSGECDTLLRQTHPHFSKTEMPDSNSQDNGLDLENGLVSMLINKQNLAAIDSLLANSMKKNVLLETRAISRIIELNCARNRQKGALLAYEYSRKAHINIERNAYLALIGSFIRTNSYKMVVEIVENMVGCGFSLGPHLNSLLIHRLGCSREIASAEKVFGLLPEREKGMVEHTALMSAYFSSGDARKGIETFRVMKSKGLGFTLGTLTVLTSGLKKCGEFAEADHYEKEKKRWAPSVNDSMEEKICNFLFTQPLKS